MCLSISRYFEVYEVQISLGLESELLLPRGREAEAQLQILDREISPLLLQLGPEKLAFPLLPELAAAQERMRQGPNSVPRTLYPSHSLLHLQGT